MNHKTFCIIAVLLVFGTLAFAGTTGKISGKVIDGSTKQPLPGAVVIILGTDLGANTDNNGQYTIENVSVGVYTLQTKMMGYVDQNI
ncbi:MAG: carboxypeptidase-like regulatory domain-containing protein, partial [Deltaproteobacteria bacterium]|nr:carboxypeptidase-like regulatory domain-containing protein [Deltaproteobacteria bacterium]